MRARARAMGAAYLASKISWRPVGRLIVCFALFYFISLTCQTGCVRYGCA